MTRLRPFVDAAPERVSRTAILPAALRLRAKVLLFSLSALASACGSEIVVHDLDERQANKVVEVLADSDIAATKGVVDTGRSVSYTIAVASKHRVEAIKTLNRNQMPQRPDSGYQEIFKESGLIPTAGEERAKALAALEGEIEKQLKLIDGILDSQVQLVLPEESALRTAQDVRPPTTASVTIKYLPGPAGAKPLSEPQVQAVVAAGVERLTADNVVVVMTPAGHGRSGERGDLDLGGSGLRSLSSRQLNIVGIVMLGIVALLCLGLVASQIRLRTVRSRLTRLQNEIAKARKKPADGAPPSPAGPASA